jgi:transposase-like protein
MKKCNCPECGKELIRLEPFVNGVYEFWCDDCNIDIVIIKNNETED